MSRLPRLLTALLLACSGLLAVAQAPAAAACSCGDDVGIEQSARRVDVVFRGTLLEQRVSRNQRIYTMEVERIYRGRVASTPIQVVTPRQAAQCGLGRLQSGTAYVVFAHETDTRLSSARCDGTARATPELMDRVESALGVGNALPQPTDPGGEAREVEFTRLDQADPPDPTRLAAPGAALVLLGLLGLLVFRRRS